MFRKVLLAAVVPAIFAGMLTTGTAVAGPTTVYCLNGVSTTLPASVSYPGGSVMLNESPGALDFIGTSGGGFWAGNSVAFGPTTVRSNIPLFDHASFWVGGASGYSTNYVSAGACTVGYTPGPPHVAVCIALKRGDGTTGLFQDIPINDWNDSNGAYFAAPAANWVEGLGLTCDNPVALGYKSAGYNVAWGGLKDPNNDPKALRGSGFNNIYPYFVKAA
jgi:hypothetical protein